MTGSRRIWWITAIASIVFMWACPLFAQDAAPEAVPAAPAASADTADDAKPAAILESGSRQHKGIHVRMAVGSGYSYFTADYPNNTFTLSGVSIIPELHVGFAPIENLEITGGLTGSFLVEPTLDADMNGASASSNGGLTVLNAGAAVTYFFMPYNIFLGVHVDISYANFIVDEGAVGAMAYDAIAQHRLGFATGMQFGKVWWVSDSASIGFSLHYLFNLYPRSFGGDEEVALGTDSIMWMGHTGGLTLTTTYN